MRVLVDEGMPVQVLTPLRLNRGHEFDHVNDLRWKGKKDVLLFRDAASKGYDAILTLDVAQLESIEESRALKRSGLHQSVSSRADRRKASEEWLASSHPSSFACLTSWTIWVRAKGSESSS